MKEQGEQKKQTFRCKNCRYFPTVIQVQSYFLNADTFKCPVCNQLNSFDQNLFSLLDRQSHCQRFQSKNYSGALSIKMNDTARISLANQKPQKTQTIWICIEKGNWVFQHLYLNPVNPELKNSLNISKPQILQQRKMVFFCINHQILLGLDSNSKSSQFSSSFAKPRPSKYQRRKVVKIEHLVCSLDHYIDTMISQMDENCHKQNIEFFVQIVEQKGRDADHKQLVEAAESTISPKLTFTKDIYKKFQSSYSNSFRNANDEKELLQLKQFQHSIKQFLTAIYHQNLYQKQSQTEKRTITESVQLRNFTLFSHKLNADLMKGLIQSNYGHLKLNRGQNIQRPFFAHNLYIQNSQHKNTKEIADSPGLIHKTQLNDSLTLKHSSLYTHHCKQAITLDCLINKFVNGYKSDSTLGGKEDSELTGRAGKIGGRLDKKIQTTSEKDKTQLNKNPTNKINRSNSNHEPNVIAYWKDIVRHENSEPTMWYMKIPSQNINSLLNIDFSLVSQSQMESKMTNLKKQLLLILKPMQNQSVTAKDIKIDRLCIEVQGQRFFYVFGYEQIEKENFEELDFVDEHYLPEELKGYSKTYQKTSHKPQNPFKKLPHRVCMVKEEQENPYSCELSDDDYQTL